MQNVQLTDIFMCARERADELTETLLVHRLMLRVSVLEQLSATLVIRLGTLR
jgi:hypothetical protein